MVDVKDRVRQDSKAVQTDRSCRQTGHADRQVMQVHETGSSRCRNTRLERDADRQLGPGLQVRGDTHEKIEGCAGRRTGAETQVCRMEEGGVADVCVCVLGVRTPTLSQWRGVSL